MSTEIATAAETAWLAKRYSREVPTTRARDVDSLYRRGLVSMVWRPRGYWDGGADARFMTFCTFCTPLGRRVVDDYKRQRREALPVAGGTSATGPPLRVPIGGAA